MAATIASLVVIALWSTALIGIPVCAFYKGR